MLIYVLMTSNYRKKSAVEYGTKVGNAEKVISNLGDKTNYIVSYINLRCQTSKQQRGFLKYTSKPTCIMRKIFDKNGAAIHEIKPVLTLNEPIYVGFTALELSKWLLHDFHYNFIRKNLMLNCYLLTQTVLHMK